MRLVTIASLITLAAGGFYGALRFNRPFGFRECCLPCVVSALRVYAGDHSEMFPNDPDPFAALQKIYPAEMDNPQLLAGISGDRKATARILVEGGRLTSNESSWVYIPGLSTTNSPDTILIYERRSGLSFNGVRMPGRAVGFVDGSHRQMSEEAFDGLLKSQQAARHETQ